MKTGNSVYRACNYVSGMFISVITFKIPRRKKRRGVNSRPGGGGRTKVSTRRVSVSMHLYHNPEMKVRGSATKVKGKEKGD